MTVAITNNRHEISFYQLHRWLNPFAKLQFQMLMPLTPKQIVERLEVGVTNDLNHPSRGKMFYGRFDSQASILYGYLRGSVPFASDPPPLHIQVEPNASDTRVVGTLDLSRDRGFPQLPTLLAFGGVFISIASIYADGRMMISYGAATLVLGALYYVVHRAGCRDRLVWYRQSLERILTDISTESSHDHRG